MSLGTILACFKLFLELAAFFARQLERADIEKAILDELLAEHRKRADAAVDAGAAVRDGRVQPDPLDRNKRD